MNRLLAAFKAFVAAWKNTEQKVELPVQKSSDTSHLRLLSLLQSSGRLVDFLKEDISAYSDAQVGAAVRKIHDECGSRLEELVTLRPVLEEQEGKQVTIPSGYDSAAIKVVGKVSGTPPYTGRLVHKGWRAMKRSLPKQVGEQTNEVVCPAEVEVS
ncbi:MAG: DUF2760 domain-containing protein [Chlamydiales bacterium]|nr:DUF2760 domain-containing protein [Chlamydiia bacterium]MCP5506755.1 DUF2760 domain-containing protein [Chlamydiales bacterium]